MKMKKLTILLLILLINSCYQSPQQPTIYQGPYSFQQPQLLNGPFEAYLMGAGTIKQVTTQARWALLIMDEDGDDLPDWWCLCDDSLFPYAQVMEYRASHTAIKIKGILRSGYCTALTVSAKDWHRSTHNAK